MSPGEPIPGPTTIPAWVIFVIWLGLVLVMCGPPLLLMLLGGRSERKDRVRFPGLYGRKSP
jgi:hypothetical protein